MDENRDTQSWHSLFTGTINVQFTSYNLWTTTTGAICRASCEEVQAKAYNRHVDPIYLWRS